MSIICINLKHKYDMFLLTCDVEKIPLSTKILNHLPPNKNIAPIVQKKNAILRYKNCDASNINGLSLTSTAIKASSLTREAVIERWNKNFLNPANKKYYQSYENIFNTDLTTYDIKNSIKFIAIFDVDKGFLSTFPNKEWTHVFETIINIDHPINFPSYSENGYKTGYKEYHELFSKIRVVNSTHNTFITPYMLNKLDIYKYTIAPTVISFLFHEKNITEWKKNLYKEIFIDFEEYISFAQRNPTEILINKLNKLDNKFTESITDCKNDQCNTKLIHDTIQDVCDHTNSVLEYNDVFSITCDNFKQFLNIYETQQILGKSDNNNFISYQFI